MVSDPKRDAQKTDEADLTARPQAQTPVAKPDAPGEEGIETAKEKEEKDKGKAEPQKPAPRPRQDSLDRERAAGEGMVPPTSDR